jgi:hypothetical protein
MSGAPLEWVGEARLLVTAPDASLERIAAWLGDGAERDGDRLQAGEGAIPGVGTVTVVGRDGVFDSLSAWYAPAASPTLAEAEAALGPAEELPRLSASPPEVVFPRFEGEAAACFVGATTWDPSSDGAARRLFQITLRRDPLQAP